MLKIIAGKYRSRLIEVPPTDTIPTKNRVREAILSSLCMDIEGARVLDLFAGSGALGIETLSRGAKYCLFCDVEYEACQVIKKNLVSLQEFNAKVFHGDYLSCLSKEKEPFDIVFLDPPYAKKEFYGKAVEALFKYDLLSPSARLVLEYEGETPEVIGEFASRKEKNYGKTRVLWLNREGR
jgi:16S rRNA (guanine966-N2)-methyltransferase